MGRRSLAGIAVVLCTMILGTGLAQADEVDYDEAKARYKAGELAAKSGDWAKAAKEYGIAYEITKDAVLFFKIATAYHEAGDCESALIYYGRYIQEANPEQKFKERAEGKIAKCEKKLADSGTGDTGSGTGDGTDTSGGTGAGTGADLGDGDGPDVDLGGGGDGPPSFSDDKPTWQRTAAWASVGGVVTFVTVGAVLGLSANSREEDIENLFITAGDPETYSGTVKERYDDLIDEGEKLEVYSYVAFGVAGAAAIASALFFVLDANSEPEESAPSAVIAPSVGPNQVGVAAQWRF
jgi:tetratricopeptide (TPR) repeat protein